MKDYLPFEWQELPRYEADSLLKTTRRSAKEHGYHSVLWFGIIRLKDHWFNNWAQRAPWGGVRKWLQRQRGVKIGKNTAIVGETDISDYKDGVLLSGDYIIKAGEIE